LATATTQLAHILLDGPVIAGKEAEAMLYGIYSVPIAVLPLFAITTTKISKKTRQIAV
jgi:hypothetical protein